ncbi:rCG25722 [Rattus norvegicus]|uniref:RCG25722 n=1 Tax=Rattus norvegicus TaxID=10116 RepID=A6I3X9_RAT|nr:rCG25722 [Rattus norvegicus]
MASASAPASRFLPCLSSYPDFFHDGQLCGSLNR